MIPDSVELTEPCDDPLERGSRRFSIVLCLALAGAGLIPPALGLPARAQDGDSRERSGALRKGPYGDRSLEKRVESAIVGGLKFLAEHQAKDGRLSQRYSVAVTALGGLAFLGYGTEYKRGRYGETVYDLVRYLTENAPQEPPGFIRDSENSPSRMHGHAYAILFLSQVLGSIDTVKKQNDVRKVVKDGVERILGSQTPAGGWGYLPGDTRDEASITVCCLQALRAAKDAGITVPRFNIDKAVRYLKDCCKDDGSFKYSLSGQYGNRSSYALTAAAVSTLDAIGEYTAEVHRRGVAFMMEELKRYSRRPLAASQNYPFYGNLYAAQVFHQLGGSYWEEWARPATEQLLRMRKDGHWESMRFSDEYATSMAILILEVPRGYLPIFER